jgi:hypothetical protein
MPRSVTGAPFIMANRSFLDHDAGRDQGGKPIAVVASFGFTVIAYIAMIIPMTMQAMTTRVLTS